MPEYRRSAEDFEVEEEGLFAPDGAGPHLHLWVEKRNRTTEDVAGRLAAAVGCSPNDVGYAGRKDRYAITRQWFSVPAPESRSIDLAALDGIEGLRVLDRRRHRERLRTGELRGNRFRVVVRDVAAADLVEQRARDLTRYGLANRFGRQRFGRDGDNPEQARQMLAGRRRVRGRRLARFLIAALQAEVFNEFVEHRARSLGPRSESTEEGEVPVDAPWRLGSSLGRLLPGDLLWHHGSGMLTALGGEAGQAAERQTAADGLEVSPTGPLVGSKMRSPVGPAGRLEGDFLAARVGGPGGFDGLDRYRVYGERRPLRVPVRDLEIARLDDGGSDGRSALDALALTFRLPPGSYATEVLRSLFHGLGLTEAGASFPAPGEETP